MPVEKQIAGSGQGLTWGNAFGSSDLSGIQYSFAKLSSVQIDNSSALDMYADLSYSFPSQAWVGGFIAWFLYPLNQDGVSYGDGQFGVGGANSVPIQYQCGYTNVQAGTAVVQGAVTGIIIPPGKFKFLFNNWTGSTVAGSTSVLYRTYNRQIV